MKALRPSKNGPSNGHNTQQKMGHNNELDIVLVDEL